MQWIKSLCVDEPFEVGSVRLQFIGRKAKKSVLMIPVLDSAERMYDSFVISISQVRAQGTLLSCVQLWDENNLNDIHDLSRETA